MKFLLAALITLDRAALAVGNDSFPWPIAATSSTKEMISKYRHGFKQALTQSTLDHTEGIRRMQELQEPSLKCQFSTAGVLSGAGDNLIFPEPVETSSGTYDFAANQTQFDAYDSGCNALGGQTITIDYEPSIECGDPGGPLPEYLNDPWCLGAFCDEADIDLFAEQGKGSLYESLPDNSCTISTTATTDGEGAELGDISDECLEASLDIWNSTFYEDYPFIVMDPVTGLFNCDTEVLAGLTSLCSDELGGRVVAASFDYDQCEDDDIDLKKIPLCVSNVCSNKEADVFHDVLELSGDPDSNCSVDITESRPFKVPKSCKAPKAPKAPKSTKASKSTKAPKSTTKAPKAPSTKKAPKSKKGAKSTKVPKSTTKSPKTGKKQQRK